MNGVPYEVRTWVFKFERRQLSYSLVQLLLLPGCIWRWCGLWVRDHPRGYGGDRYGFCSMVGLVPLHFSIRFEPCFERTC